MKKILILSLCSLLIGCGWQLRGATTLPFQTVYISGTADGAAGMLLRRQFRGRGDIQMVDKRELAEAELIILSEQLEKQILSLNASGRVREFELRYNLGFQLKNNKGVDLIAPNMVQIKRDFSFNDNQVLAKETEESNLVRDMQQDAVQQLLRRLNLARGAVSESNNAMPKP